MVYPEAGPLRGVPRGGSYGAPLEGVRYRVSPGGGSLEMVLWMGSPGRSPLQGVPWKGPLNCILWNGSPVMFPLGGPLKANPWIRSL